MSMYKYIHWPEGQIILEAQNTFTQIELNVITRFLFGEGASLNQVFNCGVMAFLKFQSKPEVNRKRAFLTTRVWRYCKKRDIKIYSKSLPARPENEQTERDFTFFLNHINNFKPQ